MGRHVGALLLLLCGLGFLGRATAGCTGDDPTVPLVVGASCEGGDCAAAECATDAECTALCTRCEVPAGGGKGRCVMVARGEAPRKGACPAGEGLDRACKPGGCDGTAPKCLQAALETICRPPSCDPGTRMETLEARCSLEGTCAVPAPASCGANSCNGPACARACTLDGECTSSHYCDGANCQPKKDPGGACEAFGNKECKNGICADGVCCDRACDGACERCNGDTRGTCTFVTSAMAFHGTCTNQGQAPCGGLCDGTQGACSYPTTTCQVASCRCNPPFAGVPAGCFFKPAVSCAAGSCATTAEQLCPDNFACNGTACHTRPCDAAGTECYETMVCKPHINPAMDFCGPP